MKFNLIKKNMTIKELAQYWATCEKETRIRRTSTLSDGSKFITRLLFGDFIEWLKERKEV